MIMPKAPDPLKPAQGLDRLFNREKFRRRTLKVYRVLGPLLLAVFAWQLVRSSGLVGDVFAGGLPEWLYTTYVVVTMGLAIITPVLFVISTVGALATISDWRFSAPLWMFSTAAGLFLVSALLLPNMPPDDQQQVWNVAALLLLLSAAWATVEGYRPGKPTS